MKVKNIMFSGVMAAILTMASGAAMAEGDATSSVVSVASTGYVDAKVETAVSNVADNYVSNTDLATKVADVIENAESGKLSQIDDVVTLVGDETTGLVADVNALEDKVGEKAVSEQIADKVGTLADGVDTVSAALELKADKSFVGTLPEGATANTIVEYVQEKTSGIATDAALGELQTAVSKNTGDIATLNADATTENSVAYKIANAVISQSQVDGLGDALGGKADKSTIGEVAEGKTVVEMIADAQTEATYDDTVIKADIKTNADDIDVLEFAVNAETTGLAATYTIATTNQTNISTNTTNIGTNTDAITKLNSDVSVEGSVASTARATVEGYAVPKPGENCSKTKCVLAVDQDSGQPYWMELAINVQ